jgi:prepilin-type N-terminal cleavage/methylation domain-containing protein
MSARNSDRSRRAGFTLTELMVSVALLAVISVYLADMFARQSRAYAVVDDVTEAQQNLRTISHLIEREVRTTGFMVPEGAALCGLDNTNTSDVFFVSDGSALVTGTTNQLGASIATGFDGSGTDSLFVDDLIIDGDAFYDSNGDGAADSDFQENAGVIVVDRSDPSRGAACGMISSLNVASNRINVDYSMGGQPLTGGGLGADLVAVPAHMYLVNGNNQLVRDGMILADGVEDLQFSAFFDVDEDDVMDGENIEYPGHELGQVYASDSWDNSLLREVRVSFVVRTRLPDPDFPTGEFQPTENRVAPGGNDGFRRRVYTTIVRPRNVGLRRGI